MSTLPRARARPGHRESHKRYIEDIPPIEPEVTEHTVYKHWCPHCREFVSAPVTEAQDNANLGIGIVVLTAWLHYMVGISVRNVVKILGYVCSFPVTPGGLTQSWIRLANLLRPEYEHILEQIRHSAVLYADETGWRLDGASYWLWAFCTKEYCYSAKLAPRWNEQLAAVHAKELANGAHRNTATLAVARKLVAYLLAVDKQEKPFVYKETKMAA